MRSRRLRAVLAEILALACATAVFVASALELPVNDATSVAPAPSASR